MIDQRNEPGGRRGLSGLILAALTIIGAFMLALYYSP
jgi:uncharacterized membrane protein required for colicin V production